MTDTNQTSQTEQSYKGPLVEGRKKGGRKKLPVEEKIARQRVQSKEQSTKLVLPKLNKVKSNRKPYDTKSRAITAGNSIPTTRLSLSMRERLKMYCN